MCSWGGLTSSLITQWKNVPWLPRSAVIILNEAFLPSFFVTIGTGQCEIIARMTSEEGNQGHFSLWRTRVWAVSVNTIILLIRTKARRMKKSSLYLMHKWMNAEGWSYRGGCWDREGRQFTVETPKQKEDDDENGTFAIRIWQLKLANEFS